MNPSDSELMEKLCAGQKEALGDLFDRHSKGLFAFLLRRLGNRDIAEDILQETFIRVFKSADSFRKDSKFVTWLFRIAINLCNDLYKRNSLPGSDTTFDETIIESHNIIDLDVVVENELEYKRFLNAFNELTVEKREIIWLARIKNLSTKDLAQIYDCSQGAIKLRIHRAFRELRIKMDRELESNSNDSK